MNPKTIALTLTWAATVLAGVLCTTTSPLAYAQSESETETEQEIEQKNVCSGWAVCANDAQNTEDSPIVAGTTSAEEDTDTLIAAVLTASVLTIVATTSPLAYAQDSSETETEQELKQKNVGSGESTNTNCGQNLIESDLATLDCFPEPPVTAPQP